MVEVGFTPLGHHLDHTLTNHSSFLLINGISVIHLATKLATCGAFEATANDPLVKQYAGSHPEIIKKNKVLLISSTTIIDNGLNIFLINVFIRGKKRKKF